MSYGVHYVVQIFPNVKFLVEILHQGPLLLEGINFNLNMDK